MTSLLFPNETLLSKISISVRFIENIPVSLCWKFHTNRNNSETLKMLETYRMFLVHKYISEKVQIKYYES